MFLTRWIMREGYALVELVQIEVMQRSSISPERPGPRGAGFDRPSTSVRGVMLLTPYGSRAWRVPGPGPVISAYHSNTSCVALCSGSSEGGMGHVGRNAAQREGFLDPGRSVAYGVVRCSPSARSVAQARPWVVFDEVGDGLGQSKGGLDQARLGLAQPSAFLLEVALRVARERPGVRSEGRRFQPKARIWRNIVVAESCGKADV